MAAIGASVRGAAPFWFVGHCRYRRDVISEGRIKAKPFGLGKPGRREALVEFFFGEGFRGQLCKERKINCIAMIPRTIIFKTLPTRERSELIKPSARVCRESDLNVLVRLEKVDVSSSPAWSRLRNFHVLKYIITRRF